MGEGMTDSIGRPAPRYFTCGHLNYGTESEPASVGLCEECALFYCHACNYDVHVCPGCGDPHRHGESPHPGIDCTA